MSPPLLHCILLTATSSASLTLSAARLQLEQMRIEVLDVRGEVDLSGHIVVANVSVGDEAHTDVGIRIGIDDRGRDRPDLALGAFDQPAHRARGIEHEGDFDGGFGVGLRQAGGEGKAGESESERAERGA
jgi:hypothetical protein